MTQDDPQDRRRFPRLNTGPEYRVVASFNGANLTQVALKNLSASGCGIQLQVEEAPTMEVGSIMEKLLLLHPDLPMVPLQGTVMWVLGKHAGKTSGPITVGLDFSPITPYIQTLINTHVLNAARDGG